MIARQAAGRHPLRPRRATAPGRHRRADLAASAMRSATASRSRARGWRPTVRAAALDAYIADPPDGAAPLAIADALARLARGELLSRNLDAAVCSTRWASRSPAAPGCAPRCPAGWQIAHKTGTGQELGAPQRRLQRRRPAHRARRPPLCDRGDDRRHDAPDARAPAADPGRRRGAHRHTAPRCRWRRSDATATARSAEARVTPVAAARRIR